MIKELWMVPYNKKCYIESNPDQPVEVVEEALMAKYPDYRREVLQILQDMR
jgi:hypothetical protein